VVERVLTVKLAEIKELESKVEELQGGKAS